MDLFFIFKKDRQEMSKREKERIFFFFFNLDRQERWEREKEQGVQYD